MEGIMMRGPKKSAMAVRNPQGNIVVEEFETKGAKRPAFCRLPVIRGIFGYIDSMTVGYRCLMRSAEIAGLDELVEESPRKKKKREAAEANSQDSACTEFSDNRECAAQTVPHSEPSMADASEGEPEACEAGECREQTPRTQAEPDGQPSAEEKKLPAWVMTLMMIGSVALAVVLAVGLFIVLPSFLFDLLSGAVPYLKNSGSAALNSLFKSGFEGILKVALLVGYMAAIALMKDIRRTFMFHGAEHKTIFCYEAGLDLTVDNVRKQRRFHPRCGTSFLILMVLVSIFVSFFIDPVTILISGHTLPTVWRYVVRLLLIPLIVGVGYELIKFAGRHNNLFTRIISAPGVWLQHLTVLEPTDDMIECAIAAVKEVIPEDDSDRW